MALSVFFAGSNISYSFKVLCEIAYFSQPKLNETGKREQCHSVDGMLCICLPKAEYGTSNNRVMSSVSRETHRSSKKLHWLKAYAKYIISSMQ